MACIRVHLFPRRKAGDDAVPVKGRQPVELTREAIAAMFTVPQPKAAQDLGVSLTALKQGCRRLGITRWPYMRPSKKGGRYGRHNPACSPDPAASAEGRRAAMCAVDVRSTCARDYMQDAQEAPAYQSDSESCVSADTQLALTSSPACSVHSDADDSVVEFSEAPAPHAWSLWSRETSANLQQPGILSESHLEHCAQHLGWLAPAGPNALSCMPNDDDVGDSLAWLVTVL